MIEKTKKQVFAPTGDSTRVIAKSPHHRTPASGTETADRDPLDLIAEEFAESCRRGETPSVSAFVARYPNHAEDLQDLLPAVGQMETLKRLRRNSSGSDILPMLETHPEQIGDYRILREIGRGGMGIVFEAEQTSLGRKVALKILPSAARADADKRERFLREAQAAARLHHTNIVPVFGVGEEDGVPYYVMQYIRGCGLDDIIHGWRNAPGSKANVLMPREWRTIARLIATAAEALEYAHSENVLHRDVKPGNLLLDAAGHLWITDFGLAKLLNESTYTATGHVLGTLQYMAPEALNGQADARTDVYGLGMTLYELLTGRMPFDETNPASLVKQISDRDPASPRTFAPKVPRDLETICLKAIAREPSRRYQSAGEFAEDLRAYLVGRPISARRLSTIDRAWLWCRRNPVVAGLSAAIVLTLAVSTFYGWSQYLQVRRAHENESAANVRELDALAKKEAAEKQRASDAEQANQKYQDSLKLSLDAIEKILEIAANTEIVGPPGGGPEGGQGPPGFRPGPPPPRGQADGKREAMLTNNAKMLAQVLAFYEKFAESNSTNTKLKFDAAKAYRHIGDIQFALDHPKEGEAATQKAVRMFEELRDVHSDPGAVHHELEIIRKHEERRRMSGPPPK